MSQAVLFGVEQAELTSDDYYTPAWVFERMGIEFDLDVCAPPGGGPFVPTARYFTKADDGLAQEWHGRVWMNPPYSDATPWVRRFIEHGHGVCLVQVSKAKYSQALWDAADGVCLVRDIRFVVGDSGVRSDIFMPLWCAAFGAECVEAISRLGRVR